MSACWLMRAISSWPCPSSRASSRCIRRLVPRLRPPPLKRSISDIRYSLRRLDREHPDHADLGNLRLSERRGPQPGQNLVRIEAMPSARPPTREQLVDDLKLLREKGLPELDD